jgi:hypothetical protein
VRAVGQMSAVSGQGHGGSLSPVYVDLYAGEKHVKRPVKMAEASGGRTSGTADSASVQYISARQSRINGSKYADLYAVYTPAWSVL